MRAFVEQGGRAPHRGVGGGRADPEVDLAAHGRARASSAWSTTRSTAAPAPTSSPRPCSTRSARARARGSFAMARRRAHATWPRPISTGRAARRSRRGTCRASAGARRSRAIAVTEPGGGSDVAAIRTRAVRDGDHYVAERLQDVHHQRRHSPTSSSSPRASRPATPASGHRGISMFLVERDDAGLHREPHARQDGHARLRHRRARVPGHARAGREPARAARAWASTRSCASSSASGWWPGCTRWPWPQRALEDTIAYVRERQAFGGPLIGQAGDPPQAGRPGHPDRGRPLADLRRVPQVRRPARSACARSRW